MILKDLNDSSLWSHSGAMKGNLNTTSFLERHAFLLKLTSSVNLQKKLLNDYTKKVMKEEMSLLFIMTHP